MLKAIATTTESLVRDTQYKFVLKQTAEEIIDDFVHVPGSAISQSSLEQLTKQVDFLEGKASLLTKFFLKPKLPREIFEEIQNQITAYSQISIQDPRIKTHINNLKILNLRLRQKQILESLLVTMDPRDIQSRLEMIQEVKTQWQAFKTTQALDALKILSQKELWLQRLAYEHKVLKNRNLLVTREKAELALDPSNIPHGFTASHAYSGQKTMSSR